MEKKIFILRYFQFHRLCSISGKWTKYYYGEYWNETDREESVTSKNKTFYNASLSTTNSTQTGLKSTRESDEESNSFECIKTRLDTSV
jgi:hypothetical protein